MTQNKFPEGWDEEKVRNVIRAYEEQTEDEAVAEDEARFGANATVMNVPHDLVPVVRELIARRQS